MVRATPSMRPGALEAGPAQARLREHLRTHRPPLPGVLRLSLALSGVAAAALVVTLALGFILDRHTGVLLLEFTGIMTVAGPQAAALFVFTAHPPPLGLGWALAMGILHMAATLFLIVPLTYRGFERLRDNRLIGGLLRSTERFSVKHRKFLARWGLLGLVLVTLAPVQGGGVLGAGVLGVLLRIPLRRLLLVVLTAGTLLTIGWTLAMRLASGALPTGGIFSVLPYAVVAAMLSAGGVAAWRGHRRRFRFEVETIPGTPAAQAARLEQVGIHEDDLVLRADLATLCGKLGIPPKDLPRARNTAELLRLDNLPPWAGERLTAVGIASIRDLASAPADLVRAALVEAGGAGHKVPPVATVEAWQREARRFEAVFRRQAGSGQAG